MATADGQVAQRSATTTGQKSILTAFKLGEPAPVLQLHHPEPLTQHNAPTLGVVTRPRTANRTFAQVTPMII